MKKPKIAYVKGIFDLFKLNGSVELATPMEQYMRNRFVFFGIKAPERKKISADYIKSNKKPSGNQLHQIIKELWSLPQRELHYFAIELLSKCKSEWADSDYLLHEHMIVTNSWWDTVDYLANHVCGPWFKKYPHHIKNCSKKWNNSDNIWLQRMSILFQLKYKKDMDLVLLTQYINNLSQSKEFFIQKAIGWILREYAKTNKQWVVSFVQENKLMPLSKREALKNSVG